MAAGHSVGEITAAAGVGVLSAEQAMVFVRERGRAMAAASAADPDLDDRGDRRQRRTRCWPRSRPQGLTAANNNGSGQIVAAGTTEQLAALAAAPAGPGPADPAQRRRRLPHRAHGAGRGPPGRLARAISTHDPRTRLLSNADGQVVHDGREVLRRLVGQVASPVRWDLCLAAMADLGVTGLLEMPPAGTLTGIAKRNLKGVELFALNTPDQLEDAMDFVRKHGGEATSASPIAGNPTWRLVVSPGKGQFTRTEDIETDTVLPSHSTVGVVKNLRDEIPVSAPHGGIVVEWLVENGDPVAPGQPLLRLHPTVESADATEVTDESQQGGRPLEPPQRAQQHTGARSMSARRSRRQYAAILGHRRLPAAPGGRQRRDLHHDRLHRRVDPDPLGHRGAALGLARTRRSR